MSTGGVVSLAEFVKDNDTNFTLSHIDHQQKQTILETCLRELGKKDSAEVTDCLSCVRILSRDESCLNKLAENANVECLFKFAFQLSLIQDQKQTVEALKALSNIIFKRPGTIPHLRSLGVIQQLTDRLKVFSNGTDRNHILLIDLKLFFILSGLEPEVRSELAKNTEILASFATLLRSFQANPLSSLDVELISEALKGAYNIGYALQCDSTHTQLQQFEILVPTLRELLLRKTGTSRERFQLANQIVNFLNIVPKRYFRYLLHPTELKPTPTGDHPTNNIHEMLAIDALLEFLTHQLDVLISNGESQPESVNLRPDELLCPIFNVLIKGAQGNRAIRKYCRLKILPYLGEEVRHLPEEGGTLRNRLCKLLTHPLQGVSELDAMLLFVLCKEDIGRAVKYTGFGNFAGFLASHALLGRSSKKRLRETDVGQTENGSQATADASSSITSESADRSGLFGPDDSADEYSTASSESDTEEYAKLRENINPVTGRWELPRPNPMEGMSEEQKEYTAMELVNQIDRLQRSGLIQPGVIGDDGRVRPAEHILELLENTSNVNLSSNEEDQLDEESAAPAGGK